MNYDVYISKCLFLTSVKKSILICHIQTFFDFAYFVVFGVGGFSVTAKGANTNTRLETFNLRIYCLEK